MPSRPRILFISPVWPLDQSFGGQMRALNVARALKHVGDVSLLVVGSDAGKTDALQRSSSEFEIITPVLERVQPNRGAARQLRWAFDSRYLNVHGVIASNHDRVRVTALLREYDLVWVLNGRTPNILQIWRWPHSHLDVDDLPSCYFAGQHRHGLMQRWKGRVRQVLLHRREQRYHERFTTLSVCSAADRRYLGAERVHVIPNGFDRPASVPTRNLGPAPRLGFIGLFSHAPNLDGMRWFLRYVWPLVRAEVPDVRLRLVGKETDGELRPTEAAVDALGWVRDPAAEIATWSAMVIPIHFGGGTRIKVADAFSRKCPVVATRFGVQGYEVTDGVQLRLADAPEAFARACIHLLRSPADGAAMADRAWEDFLEHWTWDAIAPKVWAAAEDCLSRSQGAHVTR